MLETALHHPTPTPTASAAIEGPMTPGDGACASADDSDQDVVLDFTIGKYDLAHGPLDMDDCMITVLADARATKYRLSFPVDEYIRHSWWIVLNAVETLTTSPRAVARAVSKWEEVERGSSIESSTTLDRATQVMRVVRAAQRKGQGLIFQGFRD